jgi:hypothetical protein
MIDSEPNALGVAFRSELAARTGGHALFTVELLRAMQQRGDLRLDPGGRWVEGPALRWEELPNRVEAAIAARIGRLSADCIEALEVASVEGEEFTGEVVAAVTGRSIERPASSSAVRRAVASGWWWPTRCGPSPTAGSASTASATVCSRPTSTSASTRWSARDSTAAWRMSWSGCTGATCTTTRRSTTC